MSVRSPRTQRLPAAAPWCRRAPGAAGAIALAVALAGCATQADLLQQERRLTDMMQEQSRSMEDMRREIERLREAMGPGARAPARGSTLKGPARKEKAPPAGVAEAPPPPSSDIGMTLAPEGTSTEDPSQTEQTIAALSAPSPAPDAAPGSAAVAAAAAGAANAAVEPPAAPSAAPSQVDEDWRREVAQDRAVASASGSPERAQYLGALDGVAKGDCAKMKALAASGSALSDNAVYWQGKCLAARGDQRKAEARLNEVVARYPKSDKAPAALWERGQLQLRAGNPSAARTTLARLIRDYPASAEAARARKKLAELPN